MSPLIFASYVALVILATARLTRFVVVDSLGRWLTAPLRRWAELRESERALEVWETSQSVDRGELDPAAQAWLDEQVRAVEGEEPLSWQKRLVSALDCPFCIGFWIGLAVIIATVALYRAPVAGAAWTILLGALALNYVVAHISSRLD